MAFKEFAMAAFGQLRPYAARDVNVSLHMMRTIAEDAIQLESPEQLGALRDRINLRVEACSHRLEGAASARIEERATIVHGLLDDPQDARPLLDSRAFLGGTA